uniref:ATP synthase subunit a n=1 Tax=Tetrastichus howardi TaxID=2848231 RepID=A0A8F5GE48_9HYME|nr:ATP synthase F0 subunit 6 [Tetrastichus howardi]QXM14784.1 ATP synthase F0 subunit 6 [Tetrastichus howardi]
MMMNLFSIFDPMTSLSSSMNWISSYYIILFMPNMYWLIPSRWLMMYMLLLKMLTMEFKILLNKNMNKMNLLIYISLFLMVMLNNFMGLFPYIFTSSSHLIMSMTFSLILWISFMLFGWIKNMNYMFIHLVPQGTPAILMPFMVLIESISNIIRPGTLSVRLSANIIAGHLLMTLISSTGNNLSFFFLLLMLLIQSLLIILEISVSIIQAYVISILSTLYSTETN